MILKSTGIRESLFKREFVQRHSWSYHEPGLKMYFKIFFFRRMIFSLILACLLQLNEHTYVYMAYVSNYNSTPLKQKNQESIVSWLSNNQSMTSFILYIKTLMLKSYAQVLINRLYNFINPSDIFCKHLI